jgi:hypothetical protein
MKNESRDPWTILDYESWMLERTIHEKEQLERSIQDEERLQVLNDALIECAVLHARVLCELFANPEGKFNSDMGLLQLLPDWDWGMQKYERLNGLLSELEDRYGQHLEANSPYWTFSKILAYPTWARSSSQHNYTAALNVVLPLLRRILVELQSRRP